MAANKQSEVLYESAIVGMFGFAHVLKAVVV